MQQVSWPKNVQRGYIFNPQKYIRPPIMCKASIPVWLSASQDLQWLHLIFSKTTIEHALRRK